MTNHSRATGEEGKAEQMRPLPQRSARVLEREFCSSEVNPVFIASIITGVNSPWMGVFDTMIRVSNLSKCTQRVYHMGERDELG